MQVDDVRPTLRRAIQIAREAGLTESARKLEERSTATYTTSSEWFGEVGDAILQFRSTEDKRVPAEVDELLDECLKEIGKVWPRDKPGILSGFLGKIGRMWAQVRS